MRLNLLRNAQTGTPCFRSRKKDCWVFHGGFKGNVWQQLLSYKAESLYYQMGFFKIQESSSKMSHAGWIISGCLLTLIYSSCLCVLLLLFCLASHPQIPPSLPPSTSYLRSCQSGLQRCRFSLSG